MNTAPLREGFTTGTAATAAAVAAVHRALTGHALPHVQVPLPPFDGPHRIMTVPVLHSASGYGDGFVADPSLPSAPATAWAEVEKDGGDDPDATKHARIIATVECLPAEQPHAGPPVIHIDGGTGVGRVTLPGLSVPVGCAAINPVPRQQISHALSQEAITLSFTGAVRVCISVPDGEALARHTLNARLGILGGISILGTQGTVKPFSHAAWKATIVQGLNVAAETRCPHVCLSTGRRSERLLMGLYPQLPAQAFIQAADFVQFSLAEAGQKPFSPLVWGCFFGKLLKLAEGHPYTHARSAALDMQNLSAWCAHEGMDCAPEIARCITAGHALEILLCHPRGMDSIRHVAQRAATHASRFAAKPVRIHLFHIQGQELLTL